MKIKRYSEVSGVTLREGRREIVRGKLIANGVVLSNGLLVLVYPKTILLIANPSDTEEKGEEKNERV